MSIACGKCKASKGSLETRIEDLGLTTRRLIVRCVLCGWSTYKDLTVAPAPPQQPAAAKPAAPRPEKRPPRAKINNTWAPCQVLGCSGQFVPARVRSNGWPLCPNHRKRMSNWLSYRPDGPAPLIEIAPGQWDVNPQIRHHHYHQQAAVAAPIDHQEEAPMDPQNTPTAPVCADCGQAKKLQGRGLCKGCYQRHSRAGTLEQFPSTRRYLKDLPAEPLHVIPEGELADAIRDIEHEPAPAAPPLWHEVRITFAPADEDLLERLRTLSARQRRTPEQQILSILEHHLGAAA